MCQVRISLSVLELLASDCLIDLFAAHWQTHNPIKTVYPPIFRSFTWRNHFITPTLHIVRHSKHHWAASTSWPACMVTFCLRQYSRHRIGPGGRLLSGQDVRWCWWIGLYIAPVLWWCDLLLHGPAKGSYMTATRTPWSSPMAPHREE